MSDALLAGDGQVAMGERPGHVLQRQAVLADLGHVMQPLDLIGGQPIADACGGMSYATASYAD
jgi:hypothetical protein